MSALRGEIRIDFGKGPMMLRFDLAAVDMIEEHFEGKPFSKLFADDKALRAMRARDYGMIFLSALRSGGEVKGFEDQKELELPDVLRLISLSEIGEHMKTFMQAMTAGTTGKAKVSPEEAAALGDEDESDPT